MKPGSLVTNFVTLALWSTFRRLWNICIWWNAATKEVRFDVCPSGMGWGSARSWMTMITFEKCSELGWAVKDEMWKCTIPSLQDQKYENIRTINYLPNIYIYTHTHQRGRLEIQSLSAQVYGGNRISTPSTTSDVPWRFHRKSNGLEVDADDTNWNSLGASELNDHPKIVDFYTN